MKINTKRYSKIEPEYKLEQPSWLKLLVSLIAVTILILASYIAINTSHIVFVIALALLSIIFAIGFIKQLSSGVWSGLQASKNAIYIIGSVDGKTFVEIPWKYLLNLKPGMHGLNTRGVIISIDTTDLFDEEKQLIRDHLNVVVEKDKRVVASIPTGIVNRSVAIQELEKYFIQI